MLKPGQDRDAQGVVGGILRRAEDGLWEMAAKQTVGGHAAGEEHRQGAHGLGVPGGLFHGLHDGAQGEVSRFGLGGAFFTVGLDLVLYAGEGEGTARYLDTEPFRGTRGRDYGFFAALRMTCGGGRILRCAQNDRIGKLIRRGRRPLRAPLIPDP